jgi:hypothetical protein
MTRRLRQTNKAAAEQQMELLLNATPEEQRRIIDQMTPMQRLILDADFET